MAEKILTEIRAKPTESILRSTLGETYEFFKAIERQSVDFSHEWYFAGPKSGWTFKAYDSKKILFWIFPYKNMFRVAFALREEEKEELLRHHTSGRIKDLLISSKKHSEGYSVRVDIFTKEDYEEISALIRNLIAMRS